MLVRAVEADCVRAIFAFGLQLREFVRLVMSDAPDARALGVRDPLDDISPAVDAPSSQSKKESNGGTTADDEAAVHIRVQQRNGRKSLTTVQGLPQRLDKKKILKALKKDFCCNGNVVEDPELGSVLQLQGDQRKNVSQFLVDV